MGLRKALPQTPLRALLAVLALALVFALSSNAQVVTATLTGTVTDSSGAVVPDATVTATDIATGVSRNTKSSAEGVYTIPFMPPGTYRVDIEKQGFKKFTEGNVELNVSSVGRVNANLTPGSQTETIQVTAESPLLQVESSDVAKEIDSNSLTELPIQNRSVQATAGLVAGANVPALYSSGAGVLENSSQSYLFNVNGNILGANNTMVDGIADRDDALGLTLYNPGAEDVSEVHVITDAFSAEFGTVGGAVINIVTKGGTNQFHGSLFEFNQTAVLGARNVFNQAPLPKPGLVNNDFGGTFGGPIRHNKTFFFVSYEGKRDASRSEATNTTATPSWLNGNFSTVPGLQLYDPNSGNLSNGSGRSPFPNNIIPTNEISPITQKLLPYIPAPNLVVAGAAAFTLNYINSAPTDYTTNSVDTRVDQNFNDNNKVTVKFSNVTSNVFAGGGGIFAGTPVGQDLRSNGYTITGGIAYTHLFSPTFVTEARVNVNRWVNHIYCVDTVTNAQLGIFDPNPDAISTGSLAQVSGTGIGTYGDNYECPTVDHDTVFPMSNTYTKSFGRHSLKWGGDFQRTRNDRFQAQGAGGVGPRGIFYFSPTLTENYLGAAGGSPLGLYGTTVNAFADFLLGMPAEIARSQILLSPTVRQSHYDGFIQDAFKVTSKLTINMGLRYDFYEAVKVRYAGGASNYNPFTNSLLIAGYGNVSLSDGVNSRPGYWAPRLGISYSVASKTVLRLGYAISYWEQRFGWTGGSLNNQYPVIYNQVVGTTSQYTPAGSFSSLVPVQYLPIPQNGILTPAPNQAFYYMPSHFNLPEVYSWNLTVQQQITPSFVVDAGWVGNQGRNNPYAYNLNQGLPGAGPTAEIENLEFGRTASTTIRAYGANSNYNSLQVNATKKWAQGFHVTLAYAFAKWLDTNAENGGFLNPYNWRQSYGPDGLMSKHTLTINHIYELPFGKGQRLLSNGIGGKILGGWQISGVFRYLSGSPFTVSSPTTNANCASCSVVPEIVGTPQYPGLYGPGQVYLSPSAFAMEPIGTRGNSGRDNVLAPGQTVYDGNVARKFQVKERMRLEFRLEATNVTNHPHWGSPTATVGSAAFGQITTATNPRQATAAMRLTF